MTEEHQARFLKGVLFSHQKWKEYYLASYSEIKTLSSPRSYFGLEGGKKEKKKFDVLDANATTSPLENRVEAT